MSTELIISIVGGGLFLLIGIAITMHSMEKSRAKKKLLLNSLNSRIRNFEYMLNGFPEGYLSRDLQILVCKSLLEVYNQLQNVVPGDKTVGARKKAVSETINRLESMESTFRNTKIKDVAQIVEIQKLLKILFNYIKKLIDGNRISNQNAQIYAAHIRKLMLLSSIDSLNIAIGNATKAGKFPLAQHNIKMAIDKLTRENTAGIYNEQIGQYTKQLEDMGVLDVEKKERQAEHDKEWEEASESDDSWKKKALYD